MKDGRNRSAVLPKRTLFNHPVGLSRLRELEGEQTHLQVSVMITDVTTDHISGYLCANDVYTKIFFQDLAEFVIKLDELCDEAMTVRAYSPVNEVWASVLPWARHPEESDVPYSFFVTVLFRQHYSLQGKLRFVEPPVSENFRSALELICMIRSAICDSDGLGVPE